MFTSKPHGSDLVEKGKYLVTMASCTDCHTPFENGEFDMNMYLAGGREFPFPWATLTTPNLTPDKETGRKKCLSGLLNNTKIAVM